MAFQGNAGAAPIKIDVSDGVATVTLDRPGKMNAITHAMWDELASLVVQIGKEPEARVIVLCGAGGNFSAGGDIGEFDEIRRDTATSQAYERSNSAAFAAFRNAPIPTLAAIGGVCFGGGFGLAAASDLRIASSDARFSVPAARLGLAYPYSDMRDIVYAAGPQMAKYLAFSAAAIDAATALRAGFLLEVVDSDRLAERAAEIARTIAANAPLSIKASKAAIHAALSGNPSDIAKAREAGERTFDSSDYAEGRAAFREKRKPVFRGR
ncbi:enoyl-CoA hydratase/carnithine racemase [Mesorhizobium sp. J18]|uniref:enoyl-CoA hydratase-related protein n=1 Tax=Mesorhizobium sp. J18 TaxID=935263 RepID=UPI00119A9EC6|nr:enoyl-CoA hydratase-related protein [Mesorhizobium sp. J18]TWG93840.1 enoyl-CoA hydratase/carnithine racemase [Mesorhizobium sp. J18]